MSGPCPSAQRLAAALRERQPGAGDAELAAHLAECPACQAHLEALAGGSGWLEAKAKMPVASPQSISLPLRQAMLELESRGGSLHDEQPQPPRLDFLEPSDQAGVLGNFGPYEILAHVASGGMGIVLKARDPALDRIVALKLLSPALAANALARARFVREARAAAAVVHEHVVPIYAVDECAGLPYLVMQFVKGRSLAERIRATGPLRLEEILRIGVQTAAGLAAAHAQGLVHRDVKPGNILLENSVERVRLTDFGLARASDDAGLTRTGELAGTPEFMSPEQAGNETVDHRSDLFSLGSVLYAMCTGSSPFQATSVIAVVRKVCDEQPPLVHEMNPAIPLWLSDIVARLMAKSPDARFQSASEAGELLGRYLARVQHGMRGELPRTASQTAFATRARLPVAIGVAVCLAIAGVCFFAFKDLPSEKRGADDSKPSTPGSVPEPFLVRNVTDASQGVFRSIADALGATPSNGIVELRWTGPREMPPVKLPATPLTLRAAKGFRPKWVHTTVSETALFASAALKLEDIEFVLSAGDAAARGNRAGGRIPAQDADRRGARPGGHMETVPSSAGLISISNAPLRVNRCVLQLHPPTRGIPGGDASLSAVILENVTHCEIENSVLFALPGKAILWRPPVHSNAAIASAVNAARLSLSNCLVHAHQTLWMEQPEASHTSLQLVRCTFDGPSLIRFPRTSAGRGLTVIATANLFANTTILRDSRSISRDDVTSSMRWRGSGNLFGQVAIRRRVYIELASGSGSSPRTLAEWNQWWPEPEAGSREAEVTIDANFNVTDLNVTDGGSPLPRHQWSRFGADTAAAGPASR